MAGETQSGLTAAGKIAVGLFVVALVGGGVYLLRSGFKRIGPAPATPSSAAATPKATPASAAPSSGAGAEAPDTTGITTVKDYAYVPAEKLPPVKGVSSYK